LVSRGSKTGLSFLGREKHGEVPFRKSPGCQG